MSYKIQRHKVFISYFHQDDQYYKNRLINMKEYNPVEGCMQSIFDDYSVRENDIDDTGMSDEDVRKEIRDNYIKNATVLILLCGKHTKQRKFIDWELHAAMFNTENNPKMGILVINLPSIACEHCVHAGQEDEKQLIADSNAKWVSFNSRKSYEENYKYLPSRIIDNFESKLKYDDIVDVSIVNWDTISDNPTKLKTLIDNVYLRSRDKTKHYNHSTPLRGRNSK